MCSNYSPSRLLQAYQQYLPSKRWQQLVGLQLQACPTAAATAQLQQEMVTYWHKQAKAMPRTKSYKGSMCGPAYIQDHYSSVLRVLCTALDEAGLSCSAFGNCAVPVCNGAGACRCPAGQTFNGIDVFRQPCLMSLRRPRLYAFSQ